MQKKIPAGLLPEIADRHRAGQSDQAITDWLAQLDPPIVVSRVAVLGARRRATGQPAKPRAANPRATKSRAAKPASPTAQAVASMGRTKKTGAQNRKAQAAQAAQFAAGYKRKKSVVLPIPEEQDPLRGHLYTLRVLLGQLHEINTDTVMNLPEKVRASTTLAQAMGKVSVQAELQRKIDGLEKERAIESETLEAERRKVSIERRKNEADRLELDAAWQKLNEARAQLGAEQRAQAA